MIFEWKSIGWGIFLESEKIKDMFPILTLMKVREVEKSAGGGRAFAAM